MNLPDNILRQVKKVQTVVWSKWQIQLAGGALSILSLVFAFWQCSALIWEAGGLAAVFAAWALGPVSMTVAALHVAMTTGNWWPLVSLFVGVPAGLVALVAADSLSGSGL